MRVLSIGETQVVNGAINSVLSSALTYGLNGAAIGGFLGSGVAIVGVLVAMALDLSCSYVILADICILSSTIIGGAVTGLTRAYLYRPRQDSVL